MLAQLCHCFGHTSEAVHCVTLFCSVFDLFCECDVANWFRTLDLKSLGPWFTSSTLALFEFVLGSPEFNSWVVL